MLRILLAAVVALPLAAGASPALAKNGWHAKQSHASQSRSSTADIYYAHHRLRVETEGEETVMIIDLPTGDLTLVNNAKKLAAQASLQDLVKMREDMKAQMKAAMANMPEERRKMAEKLLKEQEEANKKPLEVKKTDKTDKVAGIACTYVAWTGAEGSGESCLADKMAVDMSAFRADAKTLAKRLSETGAGSSAATSVELLQLADHGFPVKSVRRISMGPASFETTATLVSMEAMDLAKDKFEAPADYKKTTLQEFMQSTSGPGR
ncbi:MAG: DUF4412 domain-containing protein [Myxococcales bacterium]|nr:DUF4412 domain-containing protein [Myxococcales bacterium]MCB9645163.1 DUF4412 domain-containing protein [Deltaproteobacteria bacterium]